MDTACSSHSDAALEEVAELPLLRTVLEETRMLKRTGLALRSAKGGRAVSSPPTD